jgi:hypothetical protein
MQRVASIGLSGAHSMAPDPSSDDDHGGLSFVLVLLIGIVAAGLCILVARCTFLYMEQGTVNPNPNRTVL